MKECVENVNFTKRGDMTDKQTPIKSLIIRIAASHLGIQEKPQNMGWHSPEFELKMKGIGWRPTWSYCCLWAKLVITTAYKLKYPEPEYTDKHKRLAKLFSANSQQTFNNFFKDGTYPISDKPSDAALTIWKKVGVTGHTGIAAGKEDEKHIFTCYEANVLMPNGEQGISIKREKTEGSPARKVMGFIEFIEW